MNAKVNSTNQTAVPSRRRRCRSRRLFAGLAIAAIAPLVHSSAASAAPAALSETMPVWRLQLEVTTGSSAGAGTTAIPAVRLNGTAAGVTHLNTFNPSAFGVGSVTKYDLGLVAKPADITMLRLGIAGTDDWCVRKVKLIVNERDAFVADAVPGGSICAPIRGGVYLEYSSSTMRANNAWKNFGSPPAKPASLPFVSFCERSLNAIGGVMPKHVEWDRSVAPTFTRLSASTMRVSFRVVIYDPNGIESPFEKQITYDVMFQGGSVVSAVRSGTAGAYEYNMVNSALTQIDTAVQRMTSDPTRWGPLGVTIDAARNVRWTVATPPVAG